MVTTCLNSVVQEEPKSYAMRGASGSEGGFAQLLNLLTGVAADSSIPMSASDLAIAGDGSQSHISGEAEIADVPILLSTSGLIPVLSPTVAIDISAFTPILLEGGREPASGAGGAIDAFPAPLPPISPFPTNSDSSSQLGTGENPNASSIQRNIELYEIYKTYLNKVQENEININSDWPTGQPESSGLDVILHNRSGQGNDEVQKNAENLLISQLFAHTEDLAPLEESGAMSRSETSLLQHKESATRVAPSAPGDKLLAEHFMPFPALHTVQVPSSGTYLPSESTAVSYPHLYEQVGQTIEWLVMHREEQSMHLRLDPPELGTLEIRIHVEGSEVHAWLTAERDLTRQSLEQQAQQLREQLAARGLQLTHFEVNTGAHGAFERARYAQPPSLPLTDPLLCPQQATDSLHLFGQWSAWA